MTPSHELLIVHPKQWIGHGQELRMEYHLPEKRLNTLEKTEHIWDPNSLHYYSLVKGTVNTARI